MLTALALLLAASPAPTPAPAIEEAIPASARSALFLQTFAEDLPSAVDALERILDPVEAQTFVDTAPLPAMALASLHSDDNFGLDRPGGIALYRPDVFDVAVGVAPIIDKAKALAALEATLQGHGIRPPERIELGMLRYRLHGGVDVIVYVKGSFLFMVMPDTDEQLPAAEVVRAATVLMGANEPSLGSSEGYAQLRSRVIGNGVQLFIREPFGEDSVARAALFSCTFDDKGTYVDGFIATSSEVLRATDRAPIASLLSNAPAGPSLLISTQVSSSELPRWLGTTERGLAGRLSAAGLAPSLVAAALSGDSELAFYLDPELLLIDAMSAANRLGPIGTVVMRAAVSDPKLTTALFATLLKARGEKFTKSQSKQTVRLKALVEDEPVEVSIGREELRVVAGPALKGRKGTDVVAPYRSLLPSGAFGPGHVSVVIDLSQVRRELDLGNGTGEDELDAYQRLLARSVEQLTSVEKFAFDLAPELGGARLTGTLLYRPAKLGALKP